MTVTVGKKWTITIFSTAIFIIITSPYTYMFTRNIISNFVRIPQIKMNCIPSLLFAIHIILYTLIVRYSMDLDMF
jgi:hypothetical protein